MDTVKVDVPVIEYLTMLDCHSPYMRSFRVQSRLANLSVVAMEALIHVLSTDGRVLGLAQLSTVFHFKMV